MISYASHVHSMIFVKINVRGYYKWTTVSTKETTIVVVKPILGCIISLIFALESTGKKLFCIESREKQRFVEKIKILWQIRIIWRTFKDTDLGAHAQRYGFSNLKWVLEICFEGIFPSSQLAKWPYITISKMEVKRHQNCSFIQNLTSSS